MRAALVTVVLLLAIAAPTGAATQTQAGAYAAGKNLCAMMTPAVAAKAFHAKSPTAKSAARAFAKKLFKKQFRESGYRGCLAGFKAHHKS